MRYTIECSFGEIVDKYTILQIKRKKVKNPAQKKNIEYEYNLLKAQIKNPDPFFDKLLKINQKLWVLEDTIRHLSQTGQFDQTYIDCAESIHMTNHQRYLIKKSINEKYDSDVKEEKLHTNNAVIVPSTKELDRAKYYFANEREVDAYNLLVKLVEYAPIRIDDYYVDLYTAYTTAANFLNISHNCYDVLKNIYTHRNRIKNPSLREYFQKQYCMTLLQQQKYLEAAELIKYLQPVTCGSVIKPETISYPEHPGDSVLIYNSGGYGDIIMFGRYLTEYCQREDYAGFTLMVNDNLYWMFEQVVRNSKWTNNLNLIRKSKTVKFIWDRHFNLMELFVLLKKDYSQISNNCYLKNIQGSNSDFSEVLSDSKKNIVINWHGNRKNQHESRNRGMKLSDLIPILRNQQINWISVQKEVSTSERKILKRYNVHDLSGSIDTGSQAFYDTVTLFQKVDCVVSTDTSLLHLSGSMGVQSIGLIAFGCDWRWNRSGNTNWYPEMILLRQEKFLDWSAPIEKLQQLLVTL
jgi:hypothetical protein